MSKKAEKAEKAGCDGDDSNTRLRTIAYAAEQLGCSTYKVVSLAREGRLEMVKLDQKNKITDRSLRKFVNDLLEAGHG